MWLVNDVAVRAAAQLPVEPAPVRMLGIDETRTRRPRWIQDPESGRWRPDTPWMTSLTDLNLRHPTDYSDTGAKYGFVGGAIGGALGCGGIPGALTGGMGRGIRLHRRLRRRVRSRRCRIRHRLRGGLDNTERAWNGVRSCQLQPAG